MKNKIRKILISFLLVVSIFSCLCFTNSKAKADTNIPNDNSYMLNLQDFFLTMRNIGANANDYVGTTVLGLQNEELFFKVSNIWFNRIYIQISINYEMTIYYFNTYSSQRVDVIDINNIIDYNALNINIVDLSSIENLLYLYQPSIGVGDMYPYEFFNILFTNVDSSLNIRNGIYNFNFPDLFSNLVNIGIEYRSSWVPSFDNTWWYYSYIIYSPNDIVLTFDDNSSVYCHIILIGGSDDDNLTFYFLKDNFSSYTDVYYFDENNRQYIENGYLVYDEINYIYFPYNTGIYELHSDDVISLYSAEYVFDVSFNYGYAKDVTGWNDFFISIIDVPIMYLRSLTNFNIFGVNLFYTLTGILTTLFIIWIIRKF